AFTLLSRRASGRLSIWTLQNRRHTDGGSRPVIAWQIQAIRNFSILRRTRMSSEARNEFDIKYDDDFQKIREAAAAAIRQLEQLHSTSPTTREPLDAEVARIPQEKLNPYGC